MHEMIKEADFRRALPNVGGHAYLFFGEEDYLKASAIREARKILCPDAAFAAFDDVTIPFEEFSPDKLLDAMMPPPMAAQSRLILLSGMDFSRPRQEDINGLLEVLALLSEYDYNTVIAEVPAGMLDEGYLPKRPSATLKKLAEEFTPVRFEKVAGARLAAWVGRHFAHCGVTASLAVCNKMIELAGSDMYTLAGEVDKVAFFVLSQDRKEVNEADLLRVVSRALSSDAFALSNALLAGDTRAALDALAVLKFERAEPTAVLSEISRTFADLFATRVLLDAGKNSDEIASALRVHAYKAGLFVRAVSRSDMGKLTRALDLAAAADAELKRGSGGFDTVEKLICSF